MSDVEALLTDIDAAHDAFLDALASVDAELVTVPGVMEDWSVRDLVVHVAAWSEHGADALALAASGRGGEFGYAKAETDAMNARILADARVTAPGAALEREAAAFDRFRTAVAGLDPALLTLVLGNGDTVEAVIRYDGPDHYAEHTAHLRAWFADDDDDALDETFGTLSGLELPDRDSATTAAQPTDEERRERMRRALDQLEAFGRRMNLKDPDGWTAEQVIRWERDHGHGDHG